MAKPADPSSVANADVFEPTHYHCDFDIVFEEKRVSGTERLTVKKRVEHEANELVLDSHDIDVKQILVDDDGIPLKFDIRPFTKYGSALHISLPESLRRRDELTLVITFVAGSGNAFDWLKKEQTAGKKLPYLYTQGQSVLNRTFFPCFDSPAVKSTWSATVKIAAEFNVVMSASHWTPSVKLPDGRLEYRFDMKISVPVYLVALAAGDIVSAPIGPRSRVWTEPCMLDKAQNEFDGVTEEYIKTGERLFGPYVWDRYDLLVMPPSFPYGGMENPCLTFVTPTLLVGDRSLTDVVMHEISHSWFGNLVTNGSWSEFYLNEGFTMYAQRRICTELLGKDYTCLEAATGIALLKRDLEHLEPNLTRLRVILSPDVDPDDTYCETPYEKGFCFVSYLRSLTDSDETFDAFLRAYVQKFQYKSVLSDDLFKFFFEYFPHLKGVESTEGFEFSRWLDTPGSPPYYPDLSAGESLTKPAEKLAAYWLGKLPEEEKPDVGALEKWPTYQKLHFLDQLLVEVSVPAQTLATLATTYPFISGTHNAEIRLRWSQITIKGNYTDDFFNVKAFLLSQGKQKYTIPIYRELVNGSAEAKKLALEAYEETKNLIHAQVRERIERLLDDMKK
ncbi:aminopeptidase B-like [Oscarella lobularis]|uniref:aminopeptidase B-like n=1 Tax=Oscarella lobularis TaxID=121494 RepID=UPI0033131990